MLSSDFNANNFVFPLQGLNYRHSCEGPDDMVSIKVKSQILDALMYGNQCFVGIAGLTQDIRYY